MRRFPSDGTVSGDLGVLVSPKPLKCRKVNVHLLPVWWGEYLKIGISKKGTVLRRLGGGGGRGRGLFWALCAAMVLGFGRCWVYQALLRPWFCTCQVQGPAQLFFFLAGGWGGWVGQG